MADSYDSGAPPTANGGSLLQTTKSSRIIKVLRGLDSSSRCNSIDPFLLDATAAYNSMTNGPVAQNVKQHTELAGNELSNLAASRRTPAYPAATGQPLTHYHSFFSELLSWKNPRASAISYASVIAVIFAARYLDVIRWAFKLSWMILGVTVAAEGAGKLVLNNGLASQVRPRRYYTVPRETLETMIGDVHELVNFFVIEAQRIVFAENLGASAVALVAAFISYYLVKLVPYWGLAVIGTTALFFVPLVYTTNQELIDHHLKNASEVINSQTAQVRGVAQHQMEHVSALGKQYAGDYTGKIQEMIRGRSAAAPNFPTAPTHEPTKVTDSAPKIPENVVKPAVTHGDSLLDGTDVHDLPPPEKYAAPEEPVVPGEKPMLAS